jgi:hypothetical protein
VKSGTESTAQAQLHTLYENIFRKRAITNVGTAQISEMTSDKSNIYR